jgi:hypothetical protein
LRTDIRFLTFVFLLLISGFCACEAEGYEFRIQPAIALSEEYNDNVFLAPNDRRADYITSVVPSVRFAYKAPLWDWDVNYSYNYRYYARNTIDTDKTHTLSFANQTIMRGYRSMPRGTSPRKAISSTSRTETS